MHSPSHLGEQLGEALTTDVIGAWSPLEIAVGVGIAYIGYKFVRRKLGDLFQ